MDIKDNQCLNKLKLMSLNCIIIYYNFFENNLILNIYNQPTQEDFDAYAKIFAKKWEKENPKFFKYFASQYLGGKVIPRYYLFSYY